jgi:hypothetical protein
LSGLGYEPDEDINFIRVFILISM